MSKHKKRAVRRATLLVVGEGPHDKAFLKHMQNIYDRRDSDQKVTLDSADGGSPRDIIKTVISKYRNAEFDQVFILLDSDVTITQQDRDLARKKKIVLLESTPICLEGMLLEVLGMQVPSSNTACKNRLHPKLAGHPARPEAYELLFNKPVLDETTKHQIVTLRHTIANTTPA